MSEKSVDTTSQFSASELIELYGITEDDLKLIRSAGKSLKKRMDHYIAGFYEWIGTKPTYEAFFFDDAQKQHAQKMQREYWFQFFSARVDDKYVQSRRELGEVHARIGLPLDAYFAGMNVFCSLFADDIKNGELADDGKVKLFDAITKMVHLDSAVVVATFSERTQRIIAEQTQSLMELSTPVSVIWDEILMLPIVGIVDSKRAQEIMDAMLSKVSQAAARVIILDISGVSVIDTAVANHFIQMTKATRLMGCECVVSGVSPTIAQTIVALGIDLSAIVTRSTLKDALVYAFKATGATVTSTGS